MGTRHHPLPAKNANGASSCPHSGPWTFWKKPTPRRRQVQPGVEFPGTKMSGGRGRVQQDLQVCISALTSGEVNSFVHEKDVFWPVCVNGRACVRVYTLTYKSQGHTPTVTINSPFGLFSGFLFHGLRLPSRGRDLGPRSRLSPIVLFCSVMPQISHIGCGERQALSESTGEKACCPL